MTSTNENNIFRCPHDQENPYFLISRSLAKDKSMSFRARGFLEYLLSFDKSWSFSLPWIARDQDETEEMINKMFKELMKGGYAYREVYNDKKGHRRWKIYISEYPKFKKCSPDPLFPDLDFPDAANTGTNNKQENPYQDSQENKEQIYKERSPQAPTSAEADLLCTLLFEKIKEHLPGFKPPNMKKWRVEMDKMLKIDNRAFEQTKEVIEWFQKDSFYKKSVQSPSSLRKLFDRIVASIQTSKEEDVINQNRTFAIAAKKQFSDDFKVISIGKNAATNLSTGDGIPYSLPINTFRDAFFRLANGIYGGPRV